MSAIHPSELSFITKHAPFDHMELTHVMWMMERMQLGYYAEGDVIISPEQGPVDRFLIIKQGMVHGEQNVAHASEADTWLELSAGECFPLGALLANRRVASLYRAGSDVFCYELPANDFRKLIDMSSAFRDFCTRRIANLLEHSKQVIQAQYSNSSVEQQSLASPLSTIIRRPPVSCAPDMTVRQVLKIMHEQQVGSMVAVDGNGKPLGILTLPDVLERIALPQIDLDQPVINVMSTNLETLMPQALAHEAALTMAKHGFRHVLVVENERLVGTRVGKGSVRFATGRFAPDRFDHPPCRHAGSVATRGHGHTQHGAQHDGAGRCGRAVDPVHFDLQRSAHRQGG